MTTFAPMMDTMVLTGTASARKMGSISSEVERNTCLLYTSGRQAMNLKPLGDRVILKQDEAEVTTASGLFLASDAKEKPQTGTIIAVGEGKMDKDGKLLPMPVKVGDKVIYGKFGGTEVTLDGENVLILRADDIYAVVE